MSAPKLVELDDGLHVFTSSTIDARFLYDEIFREGCYDDIGLPARSLVIDVGANIGMFALFVKLRYPDAEVSRSSPRPSRQRSYGRTSACTTSTASWSTRSPSAPCVSGPPRSPTTRRSPPTRRGTRRKKSCRKE